MGMDMSLNTRVVRYIGVPGHAATEYLDIAPFADEVIWTVDYDTVAEFFAYFVRDLEAEAFSPGVIVYRFAGIKTEL